MVIQMMRLVRRHWLRSWQPDLIALCRYRYNMKIYWGRDCSVEWSFRVFRILGEHVIMEKRDAQKNILFHVRFRGLRYSKSSEIC